MNKLLQLIQTLSQTERMQFNQYVSQADCTLSARTMNLWETLQLEEQEIPTREVMFQAIYPKQAYRDAPLREHSHYLYKALKHFLIQQESLIQDGQAEILLLRQLRKRALPDLFEKEYKAIQKSWDRHKIPNEQYHLQQLWLADEANEAFGQQQMRTLDFSLPTKLHHLDLWYLHVKLRESCELLNRNNLLNTAYDVTLTPDLIQILGDEAHPYSQVPGIRVWRLIYLMLSEEQAEADQYFADLIPLLADIGAHAKSSEHRAMYKYLQNYCIKQINGGRTFFMRELFSLYQTLLDSQLILDQEELSHSDYKNIATLALRLGKIDWARVFLKDFHSHIAIDFRDNAYQYCLAYLEYESGNAGEAKRLLHTMEFTDVYYDLSARHLMVKILYAEQDWETLNYVSIAFEGFLKRNKQISQNNRRNHLNFLSLLKRLIRYHLKAFDWTAKQKAEKKTKLLQLLAKIPTLSQRNWIQEQIDALPDLNQSGSSE